MSALYQNQLQQSAWCITTNKMVLPDCGDKSHNYECGGCGGKLILCRGKIIQPYFRHYNPSPDCSFYLNEAPIHMQAKHMLASILRKSTHTLHIERCCYSCKNVFQLDIDPFTEDVEPIEEYAFTHSDGKKRKADIACVLKSEKQPDSLQMIFEICNTNPTKYDARPEPWFEFDAQETITKLENLPTTSLDITLKCIRDTYEPTAIADYALCRECEIDKLPKLANPPTIYYNQRGAGCGKTFESIQNLTLDKFSSKSTFLYLTKMRSAMTVIYDELKSQITRGLLQCEIKEETKYNQYVLHLVRLTDNKPINVIIGTVDSFSYAVAKNKIVVGKDGFKQLFEQIKRGEMCILADGTISYSGINPKLTTECVINIDEAQDLDQECIHAFSTIILKTGIDVCVIGDKLQSILKETNLFTFLENALSTSLDVCLVKDTGKNVVKRFHHPELQTIANHVVHFEKWGLPPVEGICSGDCEYCYSHTTTDKAVTVDKSFGNVYTMSEEQIQVCIDRILDDMRVKIAKHGFTPNQFCIIFPTVNTNNKVIALLENAIQSLWIELFETPDTYTPDFLHNLSKSPEYWETKLQNKENDKTYYTHVYWHRSEEGKPIDLTESENATRIMSIHASKGTGRECVYFIGLSEFMLGMFSGGVSDSLVYESLLHVGLTRAKQYLYIGIDGTACDDICHRFSKYVDVTTNLPSLSDIRETVTLDTLCRQCSDNTTKVLEPVIDNEYYMAYVSSLEKRRIDWGHHTIRACVMRSSVDIYLMRRNMSKQIFAKMQQLKTVVVKYETYNGGYKSSIKTLDDTIKYNIKADETSQKKKLYVPILVFSHNKSIYSNYGECIKKIVDRIIEKVQHHNLELCPLETIIYCHLMDMIHHPYTLSVSMMDVYRILSYYDTCFSNNKINHATHAECNCLCGNLFKTVQETKLDPHQDIIASIIKHYDTIARVNTIMKTYIKTAQDLFSMNMDFKVDKVCRWYKDDSKFGIDKRISYFYENETDKSAFVLELSPQFNTINMPEIVQKNAVLYYLLRLQYKQVYIHIATLDAEEPVCIHVSDAELIKHASAINEHMRGLLTHHFLQYHPRISHYILTHDVKNDEMLEQMLDDLIGTNKKKKNTIPTYIIAFIEKLYADVFEGDIDKSRLKDCKWIEMKLEKQLKREVYSVVKRNIVMDICLKDA